jgi:hypothetical protein
MLLALSELYNIQPICGIFLYLFNYLPSTIVRQVSIRLYVTFAVHGLQTFLLLDLANLVQNRRSLSGSRRLSRDATFPETRACISDRVAPMDRKELKEEALRTAGVTRIPMQICVEGAFLDVYRKVE